MPTVRRLFSAGTFAFLLLGLLLAAGGCAGSSLPERELAAGGTISSLVAKADTAVVLLYSPDDCFVCYAALQPWLERKRRQPGDVALVFTRPAGPAEQIQLATYRIHPDGVLRPRPLGDRLSPLKTPAEALLVGGRLVSVTPVPRGPLASPLYYRFTANNRRPPASNNESGGPP